MSESEQTPRGASAPKREPADRKPYQKPAFRQERLFETSALSCGKVHTTQSGCHSNRKTS
jgi:hypothetical protein